MFLGLRGIVTWLDGEVKFSKIDGGGESAEAWITPGNPGKKAVRISLRPVMFVFKFRMPDDLIRTR